jgi:putative ABC transport system substrate-binding protein
VKRLFSLGVMMLCVLVVVVGCSAPAAQEAGSIRIGVVQIADHAALNSARDGFMDVLAESEIAERVVYDLQNAQGDQSTGQAIARKFASDQVDLILAIATPVAQAVANVTTEIPILITAVTDPVAAGLAESLERPGGNITGTTDMNPVSQQVEMITKLVPGVSKLGIIYNSGETNSLVQVELARAAAQQLQLELLEATVSSTNDVMQATQSLIDRVDALYIPTDNTVVSAISAVLGVANPAKVPVVVSNAELVENGALAAFGLDYYQLGRQTGAIALRIIAGKSPADIPIEGQSEYKLVINGAVAAGFGLQIPEDLLNEATIIE